MRRLWSHRSQRNTELRLRQATMLRRDVAVRGSGCRRQLERQANRRIVCPDAAAGRAFGCGYGGRAAKGGGRLQTEPAAPERTGLYPDTRTRRQHRLSLIHISEPTRLGMISYAVFCLK